MAERKGCQGNSLQSPASAGFSFVRVLTSRALSLLDGFSLNPDERSGVHVLYGNVAIANQESSMDIIRIIIAILLPPLGVFLQVGFGGAFWLNILLTLLGYIPGIVHAVYIIAKR